MRYRLANPWQHTRADGDGIAHADGIAADLDGIRARDLDGIRTRDLDGIRARRRRRHSRTPKSTSRRIAHADVDGIAHARSSHSFHDPVRTSSAPVAVEPTTG